jgi:amino acid transporter
MPHKKVLGFFQLVMINVIAVDSIRTLPFSAVYGLSLVFFYLLAAALFFIPTALVAAELGTGWPSRGGVYVWVREAFGKRVSFVVIWLSWIYNVLWYPTIMALIAGTCAYFFDPTLAENRLYMCFAVLGLFWAATLINCLGMKASTIFSTLGALVGTIFPMVLIIALGAIWLFQDKPMQISFSWSRFFPTGAQSANLAFLTSVLFGLLGLEMAATHAAEMRNPAKDYPRALWVSCAIILATIVLASLALAIVVPNRELNLATGVMQAFAVFAESYRLSWLLPLMAGCVVLGGLSAVGAWIIGPTKGLLVAAEDGTLSSCFGRTNRHGVPTAILLTQAGLVSLLCLLFILLPTVNSSYWLLSVITAQLALIAYMILFAAAVKLHHSKPDVRRHFTIPGKRWGVWSVCSLGALCCFIVLLFGFLPPAQVPFHNVLLYELVLAGGIIICGGAPLLLLRSTP